MLQAERMRRKRQVPENWIAEKRANCARYRTADGWNKTILGRLKYRAKKKGLEFNLEIGDLPIPEFCPVLGMRLVIGLGVEYRTEPNAPSVDRFDNAKGYVKGNVRVISNRANMLKKDATLQEMEALVSYMRGEVS